MYVTVWFCPMKQLDLCIPWLGSGYDQSYPEEAYSRARSKCILVNKLVQAKNRYFNGVKLGWENKSITPHVSNSRSHRVQSHTYVTTCIVLLRYTWNHSKIASFFFLFVSCRLIVKSILFHDFVSASMKGRIFTSIRRQYLINLHYRSRLRNRSNYCLYATSVYWLYGFYFCFLPFFIFCTTMPIHATRPLSKISTGT